MHTCTHAHNRPSYTRQLVVTKWPEIKTASNCTVATCCNETYMVNFFACNKSCTMQNVQRGVYSTRVLLMLGIHEWETFCLHATSCLALMASRERGHVVNVWVSLEVYALWFVFRLSTVEPVDSCQHQNCSTCGTRIQVKVSLLNSITTCTYTSMHV